MDYAAECVFKFPSAAEEGQRGSRGLTAGREAQARAEREPGRVKP